MFTPPPLPPPHPTQRRRPAPVAEEAAANKGGRPAKRPAEKNLLSRFNKKKTEASAPAEKLEVASFAPADAVPHVASVASVLPVETPADVATHCIHALAARCICTWSKLASYIHVHPTSTYMWI